MRYRIIIVDDDEAGLKYFSLILEKANYFVKTFTHGYPALELIKENQPDLILLDLGLPDIDGIEFCNILRKENLIGKIPVIILTARGKKDEAKGLRCGAIDYITKPVKSDVILARVENALRISDSSKISDIIKAAGITVDLLSREVIVGKKKVSLSNKQFDLLCFLMKHAGTAVKRDIIAYAVWGYRIEISTRTIDNCIYRLRESLGKRAGKKIITIPNIGYKLLIE